MVRFFTCSVVRFCSLDVVLYVWHACVCVVCHVLHRSVLGWCSWCGWLSEVNKDIFCWSERDVVVYKLVCKCNVVFGVVPMIRVERVV